MDGAGYEFLARAAFPGDQDRGIRRRDELDLPHHLAQAGAVANEIAEVVRAADLPQQIIVLGL